MARSYIVLRDRTPAADRAHRGSRDVASDAEAIEPSIEDRVPDPDDDTARACAPVMPLTLVQPVEVAHDGNGTASNGSVWGVRAVGADVSKYDGDGVTVAVLDTGIEATHPAFAAFANRKLEEADFTGDGNGDPHGHGTHCAGTIFGGDVNGIRIGIAPGVRAAYIGKVLDRAGHGDSKRLVEALLWAGRKRAQIIAMSLGIDYPGHIDALENEGLPRKIAESRALADFRATIAMFDQVMALMGSLVKNCVVVAAAGNQSARDKNAAWTIGASVPAVASGVISVGAVALGGETDLRVAPFSNTHPTLCAPGVDVVSAALGGGLAPMSGTSMATPHVAGVAALWAHMLRTTGQTAQELRSRVATSVTIKGFAPAYRPEDFGAGLVQAP